MKLNEKVNPKGRVEIFVTKGAPKIITGQHIRNNIYKSASIDFQDVKIVDHLDIMNIVVKQGKDRIIESLASGFMRAIARIAIGDRGTIPSDSTVPKVPTADMTNLYNEVSRSDIEVTVVDTGAGKDEVKFIKTFSALDIPISAFSNQANPVINEVGLVMCDLLSGQPLPRTDVHAPNPNELDEQIFSIRTFKSVPFDAANEISITFRYTIFIE